MRRYFETVRVGDDAARDWQQRGAQLDVPTPTFARDDFRWRLRRVDGTLLERDPETGEWVTVDKAES